MSVVVSNAERERGGGEKEGYTQCTCVSCGRAWQHVNLGVGGGREGSSAQK